MVALPEEYYVLRFVRRVELLELIGPSCFLRGTAVVGETVRREKALDFSGCNSRPGTGSLHPVAIETAVEVTKLSELSMERVARRLGERAGHNVSKR
jgi:hypothetical protein